MEKKYEYKYVEFASAEEAYAKFTKTWDSLCLYPVYSSSPHYNGEFISDRYIGVSAYMQYAEGYLPSAIYGRNGVIEHDIGSRYIMYRMYK